MKRPNVERMKRHMAKSTPDQISRTFDPWEFSHNEEPYRVWISHFLRMMAIKHPGWTVELTRRDTPEYGLLYPGQVLITADAVPNTPRRAGRYPWGNYGPNQ